MFLKFKTELWIIVLNFFNVITVVNALKTYINLSFILH